VITKYKIFEATIEEYPYVYTYDMIEIGQNYADNDGFVNSFDLEKKLKRLFLNKLCEFVETDSEDYTKGAGKIKGIITNIDVNQFFDSDVFTKFFIGEKEYDVYPYEPIKVFLKEERVKKVIDKDVDPYEEEEWDDD
jgi:hypothetical protein